MKAHNGNGLTLKQQRFVDEFPKDMNATQAAIRAGYSPKSATLIGHENITKPYILKAIAKTLAEIARRNGLDQDWVLQRLKKNAERALQEIPVVDKDGVPMGIFTYEGSVANRALELLGKHLRMFPEQKELTGADGGPILLTMIDLVRIATEEENGHSDASPADSIPLQG